jgi:hypothetical protein
MFPLFLCMLLNKEFYLCMSHTINIIIKHYNDQRIYNSLLRAIMYNRKSINDIFTDDAWIVLYLNNQCPLALKMNFLIFA